VPALAPTVVRWRVVRLLYLAAIPDQVGKSSLVGMASHPATNGLEDQDGPVLDRGTWPWACVYEPRRLSVVAAVLPGGADYVRTDGGAGPFCGHPLAAAIR